MKDRFGKKTSAAERFQHRWLEQDGIWIDPTATQYKGKQWPIEKLQEEGLLDAVDSGLFTEDEHKRFREWLDGLMEEGPDGMTKWNKHKKGGMWWKQ